MFNNDSSPNIFGRIPFVAPPSSSLSSSSSSSYHVSPYSILNTCIIFFGYIIQNSLLQWYFYVFRGKDPKDVLIWKCQPDKNAVHLGTIWTLPLLSQKGSPYKDHAILKTANLCTATAFAFCVSELCIKGYSRMDFMPISEYGWGRVLSEFVLACAYETTTEYYWHRLLHTPFLYKNFHKIHHFYKAPEVWDDMQIHPLEAFIYYCILYGVPFLMKLNVASFILYMIVMGLCGTIDHSGIKIAVPGIYDSSDHDRHHSMFDVNFGFPFGYLDMLHGTYEGTFLGWKISAKTRGGGGRGPGSAVAAVSAPATGDEDDKNHVEHVKDR